MDRLEHTQRHTTTADLVYYWIYTSTQVLHRVRMTHWMSSVFVAFNDLQKVVVFFPELRRPQHHEPSHSSFTHPHMGPRVSIHGPCPSVGHSRERGMACRKTTTSTATLYHWECGTVCLCTTIHGSCGSGSVDAHYFPANQNYISPWKQ